jgi:regulator of sigma E protease
MDPVSFLAFQSYLIAILALSAVIVVHELGHFLLARMANVYVERFSVGFGPVLFGIKRGETEYCVSWIPLGGYVKMRGQSDSAEAIEPTDDPRSYQNKPVGWRIAIISAGVIFNVIFAAVLFTAAYHFGVPTAPATVGTVVPGGPAWMAGIEPGDRIAEINGFHNPEFMMLTQEVAITSPKDGAVKLKIERRAGDRPAEFDLMVTPVQKERPMIGVSPANGLTLYEDIPVWPNSAAASGEANAARIEKGDTITSVNEVAVRDHAHFRALMHEFRGKPVRVGVNRMPAKGPAKNDSPVSATVTVPPAFVRTLGLEMQISEIVAVRSGSAASRAVNEKGEPDPIREKDVILAVDGVEGIDPMRLPELFAAKAEKKEKVKVTLDRPTGAEKGRVTVLIDPTPVGAAGQPFEHVLFGGEDPLPIAALGVCCKVVPTVREVVANSPAARARTPIKPGDIVSRIKLRFRNADGKADETEFVIKDVTWPSAFWSLQHPTVDEVQLTLERTGSEPIIVSLIPEPDPTWPLTDRGLIFQNLRETRVSSSVMESLETGVQKTRYQILRLYLTLKAFVTGRISGKNFAGPGTIFTTAAAVSEQSWTLLLEFMALLSVNLAVINFLPIPVLDGGHMVFLTYELIFRRPPSERVMTICTYFGLAIIATLMICVIGLDIWRFVYR